MAIKASAQITLHYVIDIQGIYRYYLLQGSTLAKPSKPAKYPPVSNEDYIPLFTNLVDSSTDDNGVIYNGKGYRDNYRWSSSGNEVAAYTGARLTGWMPYNNGATYRLKNFNMIVGSTGDNNYVPYGYLVGKASDGTTSTLTLTAPEIGFEYDENTDMGTFKYVTADANGNAVAKFTNVKDSCNIKEDYRYSLSGGGYKSSPGHSSLVIPVPTGLTNMVVRVKGVTRSGSYSNLYGGTTSEVFTEELGTYSTGASISGDIITWTFTKSPDTAYIVFFVTTGTLPNLSIVTIDEEIAYTNPISKFRISSYIDDEAPIITCNEEIKYELLSNTWSDTEPTYQNGATNSLYFVDCTVFSDGTYEYSEVSLSTAYEAAKEAWNKAQNAQDSADSAQGAIEDLENEVTDSLDKVASDLTSFTTTTNTKFEAINERFRITAEGYETKLQNTGDGLQAQITEIMKHFDFTADGMVIGQKDNPFKTTIDNDRYEMSSNGMAVVWIEGGVFFVPEIIVTSRFKMLGYDVKETPVTINGTTIMRTDWDYIGGE